MESTDLNFLKADLITIVTPCHNNVDTISNTINSVLSQTYDKWELIIIDDCSTDNSVNVIKTFSINHAKIKLIETDCNLGPGVARNIGINKANGRYLAFLDSDDLWDPKKLEIQLNFMKAKNISFSFTSYRIMYGNKITNNHIPIKHQIKYKNLLIINHIGCLTVMIDLEKLKKKYFMPDIRRQQDYALWLNILKDGHIAYGIDDVLATYRVNNKKMLKNKFKAIYHRWQLYRELESLSTLQSIYYFTLYLIAGTIKYLRYKV